LRRRRGAVGEEDERAEKVVDWDVRDGHARIS
jgi:hypothetical protein